MLHRPAVIVVLALLGVVCAAGITYAAGTLVSQPIGLEREREDIGRALAPAAASGRGAARTERSRTTTERTGTTTPRSEDRGDDAVEPRGDGAAPVITDGEGEEREVEADRDDD